MFRVLLSIFIFAATACFADEQNVINLKCFKNEFIVKGKPFNMNEAGSSDVERIYIFNNKKIESINLERYYKNLYGYLAKDSNNTFTLPLNIAKDGLAHYSGEHQLGDTLYLPPSRFSREEYEEFTSCVYTNWEQIKSILTNTKISGSKFFGLFKTSQEFGVHGIARLIYAEYPFKEIFSHGWQIILVDNSNKVIAMTNFTANNQNESIEIGKIEGNKILLNKKFYLNGQTIKTNDFLNLQNNLGIKLKDVYRIEFKSE